MRLDLPRVVDDCDDSFKVSKKSSEPEYKRQKIVTDEVYFEIKFPTPDEIASF